MLKAKIELENFLNKRCEKIIFDKEKCEEVAFYVNENYNIPMGTVMDMIMQRVHLSEVDEFRLFCLLDGLDALTKSNYKTEFYTEVEIAGYSNSIEKDEKEVEFPIEIPCYPVTEDQWIGVTDVRFLMQLRKGQLIVYNENAQRTLQKIVRKEKEIYKIAINKKAVKEIKESVEAKTFIPNTITLNIPLDSGADFGYSAKRKSLIINSLNCFNITDGYHRYISFCQSSDENPEFNYPVEIRITHFADEKSKQFIFQEDQKTKMAKINSNSMDMNKPANIVAERLNVDPFFNLKGEISRNAGLISLGELAELVHYFYFKSAPKENYNTIRINAITEIRDRFNYLTELNPSFMTRKYSYLDLAVIFCAFNQLDVARWPVIDKIILNTVNTLSVTDIGKRVNRHFISKRVINSINSIIEKEDANV